MTRFAALVALAAAAFVAAPPPAAAADECNGLMVCIPVAGPWVLVPGKGSGPRPRVEYQLSCPRGHVVGGLDARLSHRAIALEFSGRLGSPVNPGITTARAAVFAATYVGRTAAAASFRPYIGCIPAAGGNRRVPTSSSAFRPGQPVTRRVTTARVRPGFRRVAARCRAGERLVGAGHAFGFNTVQPPSASLAASVSGARSVTGGRVAVAVRGDAELGTVRVNVQVHAVCAQVR